MNTTESIKKELPFDYTHWQQEHFDALTPEQINSEAKQYVSDHPFKGKATIVL